MKKLILIFLCCSSTIFAMHKNKQCPQQINEETKYFFPNPGLSIGSGISSLFLMMQRNQNQEYSPPINLKKFKKFFQKVKIFTLKKLF